jgi:EAL domain-containing protein (putative c-di-GMP-specific phosphodiesterase class I)/CheY-like chemotaxis protein
MERTTDDQPKTPPGTEAVRVLVVEDEAPLRKAYARILEAAGCRVTQASNGHEAIEAHQTGAFDVIVSDITMPDMNGIRLLRAVRERDLDIPVLLITGNPTVETSVQAVEHGALRYLIKPVEGDALVAAVAGAAKLQRIAKLKREAAAYLGAIERQVGDRAGLEASLAKGLETLWMAYQPIVDYKARRIAGFEALVRCNEPTLPHPGALFSAAERLGRVHEVGLAIRGHIATTLAKSEGGADVFINLHPRDLLDESLYSPESPLAPFARRIVLEITERAALDDASDVPLRIDRLRKLGFRIAIDDLGAGYAGLTYFAQLTPDVVKLDIALVRDIHKEEIKRKLVGSLATLCKELGMLVVAEGVETVEERDTVHELGCDLQQGYLFAKPGRPFPEVTW